MVKVTSEESFFSTTVTVADETGDFERVSNATPLTVPFFWANKFNENKKAGSRWKIFLIAIFFGYENILYAKKPGLIWFALMLIKVKAPIHSSCVFPFS
jgi:hypothetical protein